MLNTQHWFSAKWLSWVTVTSCQSWKVTTFPRLHTISWSWLCCVEKRIKQVGRIGCCATETISLKQNMILQLVSEEKCFSFLNGDMHLDMYLTEVRATLEVEAEELMPSSYTFLYGNIPVTAKQESLLTLHHLCLEKSEAGKDIYVLQFLKTKTTCEKHQMPVQKAAGLDTWLKKEKQFSTPQSKTDKKEYNVPMHRSQNSTVKVELYTNEEILAQIAGWRERMTLWILRSMKWVSLKKLQNTKRLNSWGS